MRFNYFLVLMFLSSPAWSSGPLTKSDFAYGIDVTLGAHQLYEFTVNEQIYRYAQNDDLRDLRIFDEHGAMVPIEIIASHAGKPGKVAHTQNEEPLVFFPVSENFFQPLQDLNVYVQRNNSGTIVNINSSSLAEHRQEDIYYIVDLGKSARPGLNALEITWDGDTSPRSTVTVQTSDDLTHWQSGGEGAVFQLRHNQQVLLHNHVPVQGLKRYLKIRLEKAALLGLKGIINKTTLTNALPEIGSATLLRQNNKQFYYSTPGHYPVQSLRIYPQQDDAIYSIELFSGTQADLQNQMLFRGSIYKLTIGNESYSADPVSLSNEQDRYWRIDVIESNQPSIAPPTIEFAFYPHRIRFLSNQAGLYTIAFGSAGVNNVSPVIPAQIVKSDSHVQALNLPTAHAISGEAKLTPPPAPKDYRKLILWAVLAFVLLVMGFMVTRLLRHMREES
ncbi:MAG TPA: DUF3999 family protein [Gammaproteobacteria bacterium]|nr:DUF3999 family protein [Gammaproteobacteria bacterium]